MYIFQEFKIQFFKEFHDIYGSLEMFLKNNFGPSSSKKPNRPFLWYSDVDL
jgi:hypothetical protein